jgi:ArsR family transcriptional regulator
MSIHQYAHRIDTCQWEGSVPARSALRVKARNDAVCCAALTEASLSKREAEAAAPVLAALADPIRLRLLSIVAAEGEVCSCNLEAPLGKSQPTISHHTRILAEAGLITGERRGKWTWWRVVPERLDEMRRLLGGS